MGDIGGQLDSILEVFSNFNNLYSCVSYLQHFN